MKQASREQTIVSLITEINNQLDKQSAQKLIPKLYNLATKVHKQISKDEHQTNYNSNDQNNKHIHLQHFKDLTNYFGKFKNDRKQEIKKFNQVEYYMFQQTQKIIKQHQSFSNSNSSANKSPIIKLISDKLSQISSFFHLSSASNPENYSNSSDSTKNIPKQLSKQQTNKKHKQQNINNYNDCNKLWQNILKYYQAHRLDQAYNEAQIFLYNINRLGLNQKINKQQKQLIQKIYFQFKTMDDFYNHFYDTGYTFDKQQKGITLWYKIIGQKDVAIKVSAEVDITIENFLCIASEIDLFQDYIPFTYDTKQLKHISRNQKIGTSKIYIPLLTDRQTYFYAAAYDRLRTKGSIFFFSKTINQDQQYQKRYDFKVPPHSDYIRLEYKYYILEYVPLTPTKGKINMVSSIDLKMDYLPLFIINKSARIFSFDYMRNYGKINKKFAGSKWDEIKHKKKDFYDYFKQKILQYLQQNQ